MSKFLRTKTPGVELFYVIDQAQDAKANIVINHGFAEHLKRYDYVSKRLVQAGYNVLRYDLRGHGQSKGELGHIDSYKDFITDADAMVDLMVDQNPHLETFMLGHSMGGLISTLYGSQFSSKLSGQILSGAANGKLPAASNFKAKVLSLASNVFPHKKLKNPVDDYVCSVPEVVEAYLNDPLVLKKASLNFYNEFLNKAVVEVTSKLDQYDLPVLILHGEEDSVVPKQISENFYKEIKSNNKEIIIYPKLFHEILNEKIKDEIIDKIISWLDYNLSNQEKANV